MSNLSKSTKTLFLSLSTVFLFQVSPANAKDYVDIEEAAIIAACGLKNPPTKGFPFNTDGSLKSAWAKEENLLAEINGKTNKNAYQFNEKTMTDAKDSAFYHPLCELYILDGLRKTAETSAKGKEFQKNRCEQIKNELYASDRDLAADRSGGESGASALSDFLDKRRSSSREEKDDPCSEDALSGAGETKQFACSYVQMQKDLESNADRKRFNKKLLSHCKSLGTNMTPELTPEEAESYGMIGVDAFGNACYPRGGNIIIKPRDRSTLETVLNATVGALKIAAPIGAMTYIARLQQKNAQRSLDYNYKLGFPSIVTAGQGGGFGGWGGGACAFGGGGCGAHYGGLYGNMYGGAGFTGMGGGCPVGACYGNGGVVVGGGTGVPFAGGLYRGGGCGLPPFAHTFVACGGGGFGGGGIGGGGVIGGGIGYPGMGGGFPGGGVWGGMPGAGGWGGYGGFPGGWGGVGGIGGGGAGGMPGPWGTGDGSNGWGGAGGPWGTGGQAPFWGSDPYNSFAAEAQAQWYQAYARQMAVQAQQQAQAARAYSSTLKDLENTQRKSYQAYMAYQMAASGFGNVGGGIGGIGGGVSGPRYGIGTPGPDNNFSYFGAGGGGAYYPPYMSNGGRNISFGLGVNYTSSGGRAAR